MTRLAILGLTGSIGTTALRGAELFNDKVQICGASCHNNVEKALEICKKYSIPYLCVTGSVIPANKPDGIKIVNDISELLNLCKPDIVLNAVASGAGLKASVKVLEAGLNLALANKESVVMGGNLLFELAGKNKAKIIPVDSEHSAIDELISTNGIQNIDQLVITASGGPFLRKDLSELASVSPSQAVKHPTWNMGPKISIDSSTLANKGLEVIEAHYLFGFSADRIEVVVHPQSIVHSMVRTTSGQVYAQLSPPDMIFPIMRAVLGNDFPRPAGKKLDFDFLDLHFEKLDTNRFPFVSDAFECVRREGVYPTVFNTADEIAVEAFCRGRIKFTQIQSSVHEALEKDWHTKIESLEDVWALTDEIKRRFVL